MPGTDLIDRPERARAQARRRGAHPLDASPRSPVSAAFPSGAHVAEVEIDPETGVIEIVRYVAVDDCGDIYNHTSSKASCTAGSCRASAR